jgi:MFS family permease
MTKKVIDGQAAPILSPVMRLFLFSMILANLGGSLFFPFFAIYLSKLGLPVDRIGVFFTVSALFPLLFQIFGGWVSDRIGRLASIAVGSVAGAVSWVALLLAPSMANPMLWFLASNAVGAITGALVAPSYDAFIAEQSDEKNRGKVFGVVQSIFLVVGIAGPPAGGFIAQKFGYQNLAWISAILYWTATFIRIGMARRLGPSHPAEAAGEAVKPMEEARAPGYKGSGPSGGFAASLKAILGLILAGGTFTWIFLIDGAFDIAGKLSGDLLPLFLRQSGGQPESSIGLLQGLAALVMALCMVPLGGLADRRGERLPVLAGCLLEAVSMVILWLGHSFPAYAAAFVLSGLAGAAIQPAMQSLTSKAVPAELRGLAYGFLGSSLGVFSFFAPAAGGWLWKSYFPALPFLASGLLVLLAALPAWARLRSLPPVPVKEEPSHDGDGR